MKTDKICARYYKKKVGLVLRLLETEEGAKFPLVLIEGSADALKMLAELLVAVADEPENDGFEISPYGPGSAHFSRKANLGIYIHRLDKRSRSVANQSIRRDL